MLAAINTKVTLAVSFGPGQTGKTVGYTLLNGDGTTFQARTTVGVSEITAGSGLYKVELAATVFTAFFDGYVLWDVAGAAPYAVEDITVTDRLDAAVGSRLATSGYTAPDNADITAIKAKTDLIPAAGPADAAHYTNARGDLLANLDAAVSTRSTYAGADTAGTTTLLSRLSATRAGYLDNLTNLDAAISGIAAAVWGAATRTLSSVTAIVNGVWDELMSGHTTAGSAGADLAAAATAGDPWSTVLPGAYTGSEAGALLPAVKSKTDLITTGTTITLLAPVLASGNVTIVQGDDYLAADGRALQWTSSSFPVLTGATITLHAEKNDDATAKSFNGSVVSATEAQVELTATQTAAASLAAGAWRYALRATLSDASVVTLATGQMYVSARP